MKKTSINQVFLSWLVLLLSLITLKSYILHISFIYIYNFKCNKPLTCQDKLPRVFRRSRSRSQLQGVFFLRTPFL